LPYTNAGSGHGEIRKSKLESLTRNPGASLFGSFLNDLGSAQSTRYTATKKTFYAQPPKYTAHMKILIHGWFRSKTYRWSATGWCHNPTRPTTLIAMMHRGNIYAQSMGSKNKPRFLVIWYSIKSHMMNVISLIIPRRN